jgi:hypothetical protein
LWSAVETCPDGRSASAIGVASSAGYGKGHTVLHVGTFVLGGEVVRAELASGVGAPGALSIAGEEPATCTARVVVDHWVPSAASRLAHDTPDGHRIGIT